MSTTIENRCYNIVNRLYITLCGIATGILGFFGSADSNIHRVLIQDGGTFGSFIVFLAFCASISLLVDLVRTEVLHARLIKQRHLFFVAIAFCWLSLLFLGVKRIHVGIQIFWVANIWLTVTTALVDAHSRGNHAERYHEQISHH